MSNLIPYLPEEEKENNILLYNILAKNNGLEEPILYKQATSSIYKDKWLTSMKEELDELEKQNTWHLVDLPEKTNLLSTRWVYKIKSNNDNIPIRYKSCLVV